MKLIFVLLILLFSSLQFFAQIVEKDSNNVAPVIKYNMEIAAAIQSTFINGQNVTMLGGYGGHQITKNIFLGGGGFGLANNTAVTVNNQNHFLKFAYAGIILGYDEAPIDIFKYRIYTLIGGGTIDYDKYTLNNLLFISDIGFTGELKIAESASIGLGLGYRFVQGSEEVELSGANLSSVYWDIHFKIVRY